MGNQWSASYDVDGIKQGGVKEALNDAKEDLPFIVCTIIVKDPSDEGFITNAKDILFRTSFSIFEGKDITTFSRDCNKAAAKVVALNNPNLWLIIANGEILEEAAVLANGQISTESSNLAFTNISGHYLEYPEDL
jgi:hypothetical protein